MGFVQKPKLTKRDFSFSGVLKCGHCGCAVTAESKRKKSGKTYVYYHCTNGKGVCSHVTYLREEKIEDAFTAALRRVHLSPEIIQWTREALLDSSRAEREFRETQIAVFTERYRKLDSYISQAYDDKLEGRIDLDLWERKTGAWKVEQRQIEEQLQALRSANTNFIQDGIKLMELANRASGLFGSMTAEEKRETVGIVLSNPRVVNGSIQYDYQKPFSMFTNVVDLSKWRGGRGSTGRVSKFM